MKTNGAKYPRIETRRLSELAPNEKNPRKVTPEALARLRKSLDELGNLSPITFNVRTGKVIGGHQRLKCLAAMGRKETDAWCVDLPPEKETSALLALNNSAGEWDAGALEALLKELQASGNDLGLSGFTTDTLADLNIDIGGETEPADAEPQIDRAAELNKKWQVKTGDLWTIGEHRLLCGDSTVSENVSQLGSLGPLMVTDPPYGVEYDADWRNHSFRADGSPSDGRAIGPVTNDDNARWDSAYKLFHGNSAYVWCASQRSALVMADLELCGLVPNYQIIWNKDGFVIGRGDYHWKHEPCWYAIRKGMNHNWQGSRNETTVWDIPRPKKSETGHSTQKPIECMARPIRNNSKAGDIIYDPFIGSGSTMVACENLKRKCRALEISPDYCAVILERMATAFPNIKIERANA